MAEKRKDSKGRNLRTGESQRKDGRYMYRWTVDGKEKTVYALTLGELREKEERVQADIRNGIDSKKADIITLNDMYEKWLKYSNRLKESTVVSYMSAYEKHVRNDIGEKKLSKIKYSDIKDFYIEMSEGKQLAGGYIERIHGLLNQIFEMAVNDDIIIKNPCGLAYKDAQRHFKEAKKRHALTPEEQKAFLDYVEESPMFNRWYRLFVVFFGTGCRAGEIFGLTWDDCDFENNTISINHSASYYASIRDGGHKWWHIGTPKTKAGVRVIPMLGKVKEVLLKERDYQKKRAVVQPVIDGYTNFVFLSKHGNLQSLNSVDVAIKRIVASYNKEELERAALKNREPELIRDFSLHNLRHTFATNLCQNTQNLKAIQEIMGHSKISVTMDIYAEATEQGKKEAVEGLDKKIFFE